MTHMYHLNWTEPEEPLAPEGERTRDGEKEREGERDMREEGRKALEWSTAAMCTPVRGEA